MSYETLKGRVELARHHLKEFTKLVEEISEDPNVASCTVMGKRKLRVDMPIDISKYTRLELVVKVKVCLI